MDRKNRIIEQLNRTLISAGEELFISLSNKGTVNRAKKDLEKLREQIVLSVREDKTVVADIGSEAEVSFSDHLTDCKCSCPSSSICRHRITAFLYGMEYLKEAAKTEADITEDTKKEYSSLDFPELNALTSEDLKKLTGKKDYAAFVTSVRKKTEAAFQYGKLLQVSLKNQKATVYFPPSDSIAGAVCSCKEKDFCRHKGYALTAYLIQERNIELALLEETLEIGKEETELLELIKAQMEQYLEKGMASLTEEVIKETQHLYIRAYGKSFFRLAEEEKLLSSEFSAYFSRNISFSNTRVMHLICKIYNRASLLLTVRDDAKKNLLLGKKKEESLVMDQLTLIGLGAVPRLTKRNDFFISAYFYCPDFKEILILSTLRPVEHQIEALSEYLYQAGILWKEELSLNQICSARLAVKNAVITSGRISGTKNTSAEILGETEETEVQAFALADFNSLREQLKKNPYQYFAPYFEAASVYLVKIRQIQKINYDSIRQKLVLVAADEKEETLCMEIKYSEASKKAISCLEKLGTELEFSYLLGSFSEQNGKLTGTLYGGFAAGRIYPLYFGAVF